MKGQAIIMRKPTITRTPNPKIELNSFFILERKNINIRATNKIIIKLKLYTSG